MKKTILSVSGVFCIVLLVTQCQNSRKSAETSSLPGAKLFVQYCSNCHLSNGTGGQTVPGGDMKAPDIRTFTKTAPELVEIIKHGYGKMPAFGDSTSVKNIAAIADYVASQVEYHTAVKQ